MHVEALVASCALEGRTSFNASLAHNALFLPSSTLCEVLSLCFCSFLGAFGTPRKTDRRFFFLVVWPVVTFSPYILYDSCLSH